MTNTNSNISDSKPTKSNRLYWLGAATVSLVISIWSAMDMIALTSQDQLWGYRPLTLLFWSYFTISFLWSGIRNIHGQKSRNYLLATIAGIMLGISFPPVPFLLLIVPAWTLIFFLIHRISDERLGYQFRLFYHLFLIWNIIATYWISNTAFAAGIAAMVTNSLLMTAPILLYGLLSKKMPLKFHFVLIAVCWIAFEYFHFRWEAHWPWLALGHYFMDQPWLIQWYEWTGILGGTLWILAMAWWLFRLMNGSPKSSIKRKVGSGMALLILPILLSFILQNQVQKSESNPVEVAVVQPNYEPHYVKGKISPTEEIEHFLSLAEQVVTENTSYLIFPETSFSIRLNNWENTLIVHKLNLYLQKHPNLTLISGLETSKILAVGEPHDQYTRTFIRNADTIYWENHNTAVRMAASLDKEIYYKSKLVPGAEFFPFKKALFFLKPLMDKLGGSGSGLRKQVERSAFVGLDGHKVAPVICYESVYGEYVNGYMDKGAEWIAVMTNDGWWDNTAGHRQHLGLSVIRAIEQRKWIARSANSGISCFIDPVGKIIQPTTYATEDAISGIIYPSQSRTAYSHMGDFIGRLAILLLCGMILFYFHRKFIKRL